MSKGKVVLAYSGGLDTSVAIKWLQEHYDMDVIAVSMDVGEGKDMEFVRQKALKVGAVKSVVLDVREWFAREYLLPSLQANALYEGKYPLVSALSRPLIARVLVEVAKEEGAVAVAHGCTGKGNDQVRFDVSVSALDPALKVLAPVREWAMSREEEIAYAERHGIPIPVDLDNPFSIDQNLWGRSIECGVLEDPWNAPPEEAYEWTKSLKDTPEEPTEVVIDFEQGVPVALDGVKQPFQDLISRLNRIAGEHGVGRVDHVEDRLVGIKSREVYECPAAVTLLAAHRELEFLTQPREMAHFKPMVEQQWARLVYEGLWYSPLKQALDAFIRESQKNVTGAVRIRLFKGQATVTGRKSAYSLYNEKLATYTPEDAFDHQAAVGFIKLWGGRFTKKTDRLVEAFTASIGFDHLLVEEDIRGSIVHARMLGACGILTPAESEKLIEGLEKIRDQVRAGEVSFSVEYEDIHMNIEKLLIEEIGPLGGKLHTARSRNDQVALDMHLYVRARTVEIVELLARLQQALVVQAEQNVDTLLPGYTHLQRAQPVRLAHHLLAYVSMFQRDAERLMDSYKRVNTSPLGAGAIAGTTFPIDRWMVAEELGFDRIYDNSMDAVSDRDFLIEFLSAASLIMVHLSRLSEELILWSSEEFGYIELDDAFCTGSSMMPQKKNPDVPELIRGKAGRVYGHLMSLLTTLKALPLTYNKDMQEDKEGVFDTVYTLMNSLRLMAPLLESMKVNGEKMRANAEAGFTNATDLADYLVKKGVPFREAHEVVGQMVLYCIQNGKILKECSLEEFHRFTPLVEADIHRVLASEPVAESRNIPGGTAREAVLHTLSEKKQRIAETFHWTTNVYK